MLEKLKFIVSNMWNFLRPLIAVFLSKIGPVLAKAATAAVEAQASKFISNDDKYDNAFAAILATLEKQGLKYGIDFTESMINAAIEAAVQGLKNK